MANEQTQTGATDNQPGTAAQDADKAAADKAVADKAAADAAAEKAAAEKSTAEKAAAEKNAGAPESYTDFVAPEGVALDTEVATAFKDVAKELGLPQASAQKVVDKLTPVLKARGEASVAQVKADLLAAAKADTEFGGEKLDASVATARTVLDACFTPAFGKFLNDSGLGNHPELIRGLLKIAPHIKQDTHVTADSKPAADGGAKAFYPNSNMNA